MEDDKLPDEFDAVILGTGKMMNYNQFLPTARRTVAVNV